MADAERKVAALKKAYAEIILNMAQESAARILVSERRAIGFQRSLLAAKEEAVATLLRLKSIMESKIREAEIASLGQVRRIQELEHQLNKAQVTIGHLRTELKWMSSEMGNMSNRPREASGEANMDDLTISGDDICQVGKLSSHSVPCSPLGPESVLAEKEDVNFNQLNTNDCCHRVENTTKTEEMGMENECAGNPDLASIIMRSKEPELFRNGCTQRIRAFEQNLLTMRVPSAKTDNISPKGALIACEHGKSKIAYPVDSTMAGTALIGMKDHVDLEVFAQQASNCKHEEVKFFRRSSRKKQAKAKGNRSTSSVTSDRGMVDQQPSHINSQNIAAQVKAMGHKETQLQEACEETGKILSSLSCPVISRCSNKLPKTIWIHSKISSSNGISGKLDSDEGRMPKLGSIDADSSLLTETEKEGDVLLTGGDQIVEGPTLQPEDLMSSIEKRAANNGYSPTCEIKLQMAEAPNSDSCSEDGKSSESIKVTPETGNDQFLKYTFRRKRKIGSSSSKSESMVPEQKNTSKRRAVEKQDSLPEAQKPSLIAESTRDSRRMAQVARQLISLSEKRWW